MGGPLGDVGRTTAALNLREQPNTSARVLLVMPAGVTVQVGDQVNNGFRLVSYNGTSDWAFASYLAQPSRAARGGRAELARPAASCHIPSMAYVRVIWA